MGYQDRMLAALVSLTLTASVPAQAAARAPVPCTGVVVDLLGEPIAGAAVWATNDPTRSYRPSARPVARTTTDEHGRFRLPRLQPEDCSVWASAPGRCHNRKRFTAAPLTIELHDAATLHGVLRTPAGDAVPNATVRAVDLGYVMRDANPETTTAADGRFELEGVPLGLVRVAAVVPGHGILGRTLVVQHDAEVRLVRWTKTTTTLDVTIADLPPELAPAVDLGLLVTHGPQLPPPWDRPQLDLGGHWSQDLLPDVSYTIRPKLPGFVFEPDEYEFLGTQGPHAARFRALPRPRWNGRVRDLHGRPVAGVEIEVRQHLGRDRARTVTDDRGAFELLSPVADGTRVDVLCHSQDWVLDIEPERLGTFTLRRSRLRTVANSRQPLELIVKPANTISGRLVLPDGGPAAFVTVYLQSNPPRGTPRWRWLRSTTTGPSGEFRFTGISTTPDPVRVASHTDAGQFEGAAFELSEPAQVIRLGEHRLAPPGVVEGTVRNAENALSPGVRVELRTASRSRKTVTDRAGRYRFAGVPTGDYHIDLITDQRHREALRSAPFSVAHGTRLTRDLVLQQP